MVKDKKKESKNTVEELAKQNPELMKGQIPPFIGLSCVSPRGDIFLDDYGSVYSLEYDFSTYKRVLIKHI